MLRTILNCLRSVVFVAVFLSVFSLLIYTNSDFFLFLIARRLYSTAVEVLVMQIMGVLGLKYSCKCINFVSLGLSFLFGTHSHDLVLFMDGDSFPSIPSNLTPLPAGSLPSVPSLPDVGSDLEVEQPVPLHPLDVDDTTEPFNQPHGYWFLKRLILDYLRATLDTNFDRPPSIKKYRRVFELVIGPTFRSKTRLIEVFATITNNPANNPIKDRASMIMNAIYEQEVKDRDLENWNFED